MGRPGGLRRVSCPPERFGLVARVDFFFDFLGSFWIDGSSKTCISLALFAELKYCFEEA